MSNGRLKASTNRVRTSIALQQTSIWTKAIGMEERENTNSIIEATLNAPGMGAGSKRGESRRAAAAQAVEATGSFGGNAVDSYSALLDVARSQGALGGLNRGACKRCGQLGHLTKQCRNQFSRFFDGGPNADKAQAAAAAAGVPTAAIAMAPIGAEGDGIAGGASSSDDSMSGLALGSDSDSGSSSDGSAERRRRKERKRKRKERKEKERKRKHKHHSSSKSEKKSRKRKRQRRSPSASSSIY